MANRRYQIAQSADPEPLISLYDMDMSKRGGPVLRWTPGPMGSGSTNFCWNPSPRIGIAGWSSTSTNRVFFGPAPDPWRVRKIGGAMGRWTLTTGTVADMVWAQGTEMRVTPGQVMHAAVSVVRVRCSVQVILDFFDDTGTRVSQYQGPLTTVGGDASSADRMDLYTRIFHEVAAPTGATKCRLIIRARPPAGQSSVDAIVCFNQVTLTPVPGLIGSAMPPAGNGKGGSVSFGGLVYTPMPLEIAGLSWTGTGPVPRPSLTVPDINSFATQLMIPYKDLLNCKITRRQVFRSSLDNSVAPDATDFYAPEIWLIGRVGRHIPGRTVTFELMAPLDIPVSYTHLTLPTIYSV